MSNTRITDCAQCIRRISGLAVGRGPSSGLAHTVAFRLRGARNGPEWGCQQTPDVVPIPGTLHASRLEGNSAAAGLALTGASITDQRKTATFITVDRHKVTYWDGGI